MLVGCDTAVVVDNDRAHSNWSRWRWCGDGGDAVGSRICRRVSG